MVYHSPNTNNVEFEGKLSHWKVVCLMSGNWISHVTEMQKNTTALRTVVIYSIFWMQKIATSDRGQRGWIKWRNCGCISAMWHLVKWSPTIRQPILVRFGQSQVKQSRFNAFGGIQEPFLLNSFKIRWCMTTILNYFGLFRIIFIWNRDSHLHEAVGGGHHLRPPLGFQNIYWLRKLLFLVLGARCHHLAFCQINANMSGWSWN